jgi:CheY-like chemotaxis protein
MARQRPPQRRAVQLGEVVQAALDLLGYILRGHGIAVEQQMTDALPDVQADPDQLGQVVLNLLVNAQQALTAQRAEAAQPPRIVLSSGLEQQRPGRQARVWLRVADNGPGVPAALRGQIFQPFFTTKSDGLGTGLGLSVSQGILREHGGSLVLEESEVGACFRLSLPLTGQGDTFVQASLPATEPAQARGGRVLVVDDEAELSDMMRVMLEGAGLEVATAESGAVALEMLREVRFDAVVSDLRMPDMDGPSLWQAVCEHDATLACRMLFVSGDTLSGAAQQWLQAQGLPSLDKPFSSEELLAAVRRLMA